LTSSSAMKGRRKPSPSSKSLQDKNMAEFWRNHENCLRSARTAAFQQNFPKPHQMAMFYRGTFANSE
jgi:hypothetical protein